MRRHRLQSFLSAAIIITGLFGCGGNSSEPSPADNARDRQVILTHWAENIIIPSYGALQETFHELHEHGDAFIDNPAVERLALLRHAWKEAYIAWQRVELFEFGPADQYTLRNFMNIYPADVAGIAANISNPDANLDLPAAYARQGFPALDYLINGVGETDDAIVVFYTTAPEAEARTAYLKRLLHRMEALLTGVISGWQSYRNTFISQTGLDIGSSFGLVVNSFVLHYERFIRTGKIGIPAGISVGGSGAIHPEKMEAYYKKDISLSLAAVAHEAAVGFFNGVAVVPGAETAPSFKTYLDDLGAKDKASDKMLSTLINDQFEDTAQRLEALSPDLGHEIETNHQAVLALYSSLQAAVRMLKVDMTSAMSVTITYTDNDGD